MDIKIKVCNFSCDYGYLHVLIILMLFNFMSCKLGNKNKNRKSGI